MQSLKYLYRIGSGPSSSHTMGPISAAMRFCAENPDADEYKVVLFGSLAKTGKGHMTDTALARVFEGKKFCIEFNIIKCIYKIGFIAYTCIFKYCCNARHYNFFAVYIFCEIIYTCSFGNGNFNTFGFSTFCFKHFCYIIITRFIIECIYTILKLAFISFQFSIQPKSNRNVNSIVFF